MFHISIGLQLWHLLRYPPTQQRIFKESVRRSSGRLFRLEIGRWGQIAVLLCLALAFLLSRTLFVILIAVVPFILIAGFILMSGNFYGGWRAVQAVNRLTRLRRTGFYQQLQLTHPGEIGVLLLVNAGFLHRVDLLREIHNLLKMSLRLVLMGTGLLSAILIVGTIFSPPPISGEPGGLIILSGVLPIAALAIILYIDFVYAIVTASLLSTLVVQFTNQRFEAQSGTAVLFIATQLLQYSLWILLIIMSSFAVQALIGMTSLISICLTIFAACLFYIIREAVAGLLWRMLLHKTGTNLHEWRNFQQWWTG